MQADQSYAQTIVQFYRQLLDRDLGERDIVRIKRAYEFVARLHSARFRASGRPFTAHLIGTASLLAEITSDVDVILTGLLHGVYDQGDFGDGRRIMTERKRAIVRDAVGEAVEDRIAAFSRLSWGPGLADELVQRFDGLDLIERDALLVRLVNELDEFIEMDVLYSADYAFRIDQLAKDCASMSALAIRLGHPPLATMLQETTAEAERVQLPAFVRSAESYCFDIVPSSYLRRPLAAFNYRRPKLRWQLSRVRRKLLSWFPRTDRSL
jgi:(p)ppGpp synthase/HD superfamily hydrolase